VTPDSQRGWGTMEVDQMLHHLNLACGGSQGFYNLPGRSSSGFSSIGIWNNRWACDFRWAPKSHIRRGLSSHSKSHNCSKS
jgi:hypothetical protein